MKPGKIIAAMFICAVMVINLSASARAAGETAEKTIPLKSLASGVMDEADIEKGDSCTLPRAFGSIDVTVSAHKARKSESRFPMEAGQTVTLDCRYTPNSASVDFGLIAPNGYFYYVNSTSGSINQAIQIVELGHYTLAVRNNSSEAVSIAGYVYY